MLWQSFMPSQPIKFSTCSEGGGTARFRQNGNTTQLTSSKKTVCFVHLFLKHLSKVVSFFEKSLQKFGIFANAWIKLGDEKPMSGASSALDCSVWPIGFIRLPSCPLFKVHEQSECVFQDSNTLTFSLAVLWKNCTPSRPIKFAIHALTQRNLEIHLLPTNCFQ